MFLHHPQTTHCKSVHKFGTATKSFACRARGAPYNDSVEEILHFALALKVLLCFGVESVLLQVLLVYIYSVYMDMECMMAIWVAERKHKSFRGA